MKKAFFYSLLAMLFLTTATELSAQYSLNVINNTNCDMFVNVATESVQYQCNLLDNNSATISANSSGTITVASGDYLMGVHIRVSGSSVSSGANIEACDADDYAVSSGDCDGNVYHVNMHYASNDLEIYQ